MVTIDKMGLFAIDAQTVHAAAAIPTLADGTVLSLMQTRKPYLAIGFVIPEFADILSEKIAEKEFALGKGLVKDDLPAPAGINLSSRAYQECRPGLIARMARAVGFAEQGRMSEPDSGHPGQPYRFSKNLIRPILMVKQRISSFEGGILCSGAKTDLP